MLLSFTSCLLMWVCLKTERLRWGSPTATAPFALLDFGLCAFVTRSLSLSKGQPSPFAFVILANAGIHSWFSFYAFPCHSVANASVFYFLFIDVGVFEDRAVAMGKPHCNRSICTFRLWNMRFCRPVPELVEGSNLHRAFVILANAGKMNVALKPRRGEIR